MTGSPAAQSWPHRHAAKFYASERHLYETAAGFLGEGLITGQAAVIIATPSHADAIQDQLTDRFIDVARAKRSGDLVVLDAERTLASILIEGQVDPGRFDAAVRRVIEASCGRRHAAHNRTCGEMVDILRRRGQTDAVLALERRWNSGTWTSPCTVLCGYSMVPVFAQTAHFQEICRQHSHVFDPGSSRIVFSRRGADM